MLSADGNHTTSYVAFTENERLIVKADIKHWPYTVIEKMTKQELENYVYQIENTLNKPNVALELKRNNKAGECTSSYQTLHPNAFCIPPSYHAHFPGGQLTPIGTAWYLFKTEEDLMSLIILFT
nr:13194_t:CDS:2 [Entrophospora candida]